MVVVAACSDSSANDGEAGDETNDGPLTVPGDGDPGDGDPGDGDGDGDPGDGDPGDGDPGHGDGDGDPAMATAIRRPDVATATSILARLATTATMSPAMVVRRCARPRAS